MREIKFRAWNNSARQMRYSFNIISHGEWNILCLSDLLVDWNGKDNYILMQYTGFNDKNGKEIYEGDIILFDLNNPTTPQKCIIQWGTTIEGNFETGWWIIGQEPFYNQRVKNSADLLVSNEQKEIEVIGNIYENPELIKETK